MTTKWRKALLAAAMVVGTVPVAAAGEVAMQWGGLQGDHELLVAYQTAPLWSGDLGGGRFGVAAEVSLGHAQPPAGQPGGALWHIGVAPVARWHVGPSTDFELGVGANLFSATRLGLREFSTAFQFGDFIGIEQRLNGSPWRAGLRLSHYSNADIKRPNRGQDYIEVRLGYAFD